MKPMSVSSAEDVFNNKLDYSKVKYAAILDSTFLMEVYPHPFCKGLLVVYEAVGGILVLVFSTEIIITADKAYDHTKWQKIVMDFVDSLRE